MRMNVKLTFSLTIELKGFPDPNWLVELEITVETWRKQAPLLTQPCYGTCGPLPISLVAALNVDGTIFDLCQINP